MAESSVDESGPLDLIFWALITTFFDVKDVSVLFAGPFFNLPTFTTFFYKIQSEICIKIQLKVTSKSLTGLVLAIFATSYRGSP